MAWTPEKLNSTEHLYGFKWDQDGRLIGWFAQDDFDVAVTVCPVDDKTCEVWVESEGAYVVGTVNQIEYLCRRYCREHWPEDFDGEALNEE